MNATLITLRRRINDEIRKLSIREKLGGAIAFFAVALLVVSRGVDTVQGLFENQTLEMETAQRDVEEVTRNLVWYTQLSARKQSIEAQYKQVEMSEGVRSFLENLLRTKGGVSSGYTIKELPTTPFGGNYELAPYSVRFSATSLKDVVAFLDELVHGRRPLILTELELKKNRQGDRLEVSIGVNSIRKEAKEGEASPS